MKTIKYLIMAVLIFGSTQFISAEPAHPGFPNQPNGSDVYVDPYTGRVKIPAGGGDIDAQTGRFEPYGTPRPDYNQRPSPSDSGSDNNPPSLPSSSIPHHSYSDSVTCAPSEKQADDWSKTLENISSQIKQLALENKNLASNDMKNQAAMNASLQKLLVQKLRSDEHFKPWKLSRIRLLINGSWRLKDEDGDKIMDFTPQEVSDAGFLVVHLSPDDYIIVYKPMIPPDAGNPNDLVKIKLTPDDLKSAMDFYNATLEEEIARRNAAIIMALHSTTFEERIEKNIDTAFSKLILTRHKQIKNKSGDNILCSKYKADQAHFYGPTDRYDGHMSIYIKNGPLSIFKMFNPELTESNFELVSLYGGKTLLVYKPLVPANAKSPEDLRQAKAVYTEGDVIRAYNSLLDSPEPERNPYGW